MQRMLVTGGAGFIGSNFVRYVLANYAGYAVTVLDKLTYAGNLANLADVEADPRYRFVRGDIADPVAVREAMDGCELVLNFAAESHVDRSIEAPGDFIQTDVFGVYVLLEEARRRGVARFLQVSTDEVYGAVMRGSSVETDILEPRSPYSASKAGGEMMVQAYFVTYGLPTIITRGSNTYGPYQYPEKMIPLFVTNALTDQPLPVYGDGKQVRDWLHVLDHASGILVALEKGTPGEVYNIGGGNERYNIDVTEAIIGLTDKPRSLITYVTDRPGHDRRYSLDTAKLRGLGWSPVHSFDDGLRETVTWYEQNRAWWEAIKAGEFRDYYARVYANR